MRLVKIKYVPQELKDFFSVNEEVELVHEFELGVMVRSNLPEWCFMLPIDSVEKIEKETLQEAAEKYSAVDEHKMAFVAGAKWMTKRIGRK